MRSAQTVGWSPQDTSGRALSMMMSTSLTVAASPRLRMGVPLSSLFSLSLLLTSALPPLESSMALSATTATHPNMTSGMRMNRMASRMRIFAQLTSSPHLKARGFLSLAKC